MHLHAFKCFYTLTKLTSSQDLVVGLLIFHLLALLVAEAKELAAHVLLQHEVVVDAAGHVWEPHVQGALAVDVGKLGADGQLEDGNLLGDALLTQEPGHQVSDCGLALVTGDGLGGGDGGDGGDGEDKELHAETESSDTDMWRQVRDIYGVFICRGDR